MKFLFDECYTKDGEQILGDVLDKLFDPPNQSAFLTDWLREKGQSEADIKEGVWDEDWAKLPTVAEKQGLIVVSCDNGQSRKSKAKGAPLHIELPRNKIWGVFLSAAFGRRDRFIKTLAVASVLRDILAVVPRSAPGARFKIQTSGNGYALNGWPLTKHENKMFKP